MVPASLVGPKRRRYIVVNGHLAMSDGEPIVALKEASHVAYYKRGKTGLTPLENGDKLLNDLFIETDCSELFDDSVEGKRRTFDVDSFTGAVICESDAHSVMYNFRTASTNAQLSVKEKQVFANFACDLACNYNTIFDYLMSGRYSYRSLAIRGHLVAGLFQPVVASTPFISSPFDYSEFTWAYDRMAPRLKTLSQFGSDKGDMNLSVISTADFCDLIGLDIHDALELNNKIFMYVLITSMLGAMGRSDLVRVMAGRFPAMQKALHKQGSSMYRLFTSAVSTFSEWYNKSI